MARDDANWAKPVRQLEAADVAGAWNANVRGRRLNAANGGFGRLFQKTFTVSLVGASATPQDVIKTWKTHFAEFWPKGQKMFLPATGIAPGEIGLINASIPGTPTMATGVLVIYADDESFSFMSPEGHPFAGPLTFSAQVEDGVTVAQVHELTRASDPFWEIAMMMPVLNALRCGRPSGALEDRVRRRPPSVAEREEHLAERRHPLGNRRSGALAAAQLMGRPEGAPRGLVD